jgi:hypothetical protein
MKSITLFFFLFTSIPLFSQPEETGIYIALVGPMELVQIWNSGDCGAVPVEQVFAKDTSLFSNQDSKVLCYGVLYANLCLAVKWKNPAILNHHFMVMSKIGPALNYPEIAPFKQRIILNNKNQDSLFAITSDMGFELESYLDDNEKQHEHLLLNAASTIEIFYQYSTACRNTRMTEAQAYFYIFRLFIDNLNTYNEQLATGEIKWLKSELESIRAILPQEEFASSYPMLTQVRFDAIAAGISALRKTIVR